MPADLIPLASFPSAARTLRAPLAIARYRQRDTLVSSKNGDSQHARRCCSPPPRTTNSSQVSVGTRKARVLVLASTPFQRQFNFNLRSFSPVIQNDSCSPQDHLVYSPPRSLSIEGAQTSLFYPACQYSHSLNPPSLVVLYYSF